MTSPKAVFAAFILASVGTMSPSYSADVAEESEGATKEPTTLLNSAVVETDHGPGLGPNGEDLHYSYEGPGAADEDAELMRRSLIQPSPIDASSEAELVSAIEGSQAQQVMPDRN